MKVRHYGRMAVLSMGLCFFWHRQQDKVNGNDWIDIGYGGTWDRLLL
jgi:hypothetical protein